jgi:hypothetical protein
MFVRTVVRFVFTLHLLCGVLLCKPAFAQRPDLDPPTATLDDANADSSNRRVAPTTIIARSSARRDSRWVPPEVDDDVSPLDSGLACELDELLQKAGERIQEFVKNVDRFTATESLLHESFNKSGKSTSRTSQVRLHDVDRNPPENADVEEFLPVRPMLRVAGVASRDCRHWYSFSSILFRELLDAMRGDDLEWEAAWQICFPEGG